MIMLGAILIPSVLYYFYLGEETILSYVYTTLIGILELELFLSLIPWPIDPKGKSLILVGSFYFFTEMIRFKKEESLSWQKAVSLAILILIIIVMVILTSQWYKY